VTWLDDASPDGSAGTADDSDAGSDDAADAAASDSASLPSSIHLELELAQPLRYGENPHQLGARYRQVGATSWWDSMTQHGGKALSYLNVFDTEAAWRLVHDSMPPPSSW
jgi:phosphoribosylaminoimidazolecarboxamide formyltransferase / IMP cyclohydrolase